MGLIERVSIKSSERHVDAAEHEPWLFTDFLNDYFHDPDTPLAQ